MFGSGKGLQSAENMEIKWVPEPGEPTQNTTLLINIWPSFKY